MSNILIVDDNRQTVQHLRTLLNDFGYNSNFVPRAKYVFPILEREEFDLILMDVNMPDMDGVSLLEQLQEHVRYKTIPIVMVTGDSNDQLLQHCFEVGAVDYLSKPIRVLELKARIQAILELQQERARSKALLENILPKQVADELLHGNQPSPQYFEEGTVVFTDFHNFTDTASRWEVGTLVDQLGKYFDYFDEVMELYGVEKIKTMGDGYLFAGGIPQPSHTHAIDCVLAAMEIRNFTRTIQENSSDPDLEPWQLRIGIHSGPLMAGVIGSKKFAYDIWGDTVNTASRLETAGIVAEINISETTYRLVEDFFSCKPRERLELKGKGEIPMFLVRDIHSELRHSSGLPNEHFWEKYGNYYRSEPTEKRVVRIHQKGVEILHFFGTLSMKNFREIKKIVNDVVKDETVSKVLFNLSQVSFMDSHAMGFFISCLLLLRRRQAKLALCGLNEKLYQCFELSQLELAFQIHSEESEALAHL